MCINVNEFYDEILLDICNKLFKSKKLKVKPSVAVNYLKNRNKKITKQQLIIPFCGIIFDNRCYAMRKNHGLYTQCRNKPSVDGYCTICYSASLNSPSEKPPRGDIRERSELIKQKRLPGLLKYGNIMEKLKITKREAILEASRFNLTIPEEEFNILVKKRGRPKKQKSLSNVVYDTDDSEEEEELPKINKEELMWMEMADECSV
jgi:hypothetical protein